MFGQNFYCSLWSWTYSCLSPGPFFVSLGLQAARNRVSLVSQLGLNQFSAWIDPKTTPLSPWPKPCLGRSNTERIRPFLGVNSPVFSVSPSDNLSHLCGHIADIHRVDGEPELVPRAAVQSPNDPPDLVRGYGRGLPTWAECNWDWGYKLRGCTKLCLEWNPNWYDPINLKRSDEDCGWFNCWFRVEASSSPKCCWSVWHWEVKTQACNQWTNRR